MVRCNHKRAIRLRSVRVLRSTSMPIVSAKASILKILIAYLAFHLHKKVARKGTKHS